MTYQPDVAVERDGVRWIEPVIVTSRGYVDILHLRPAVEVRLYVRHLGVVVGPRDFVQLVTRSGTLSGELPTAIRFLPTSPLGHEPLRVELRDLNNVYSDDRVEDGDLVMIEIGPPGEVPDRCLFRSNGWFAPAWRRKAVQCSAGGRHQRDSRWAQWRPLKSSSR